MSFQIRIKLLIMIMVLEFIQEIDIKRILIVRHP